MPVLDTIMSSYHTWITAKACYNCSHFLQLTSPKHIWIIFLKCNPSEDNLLIKTVQWFFISLVAAKSLQSCLILCDYIDGSPPGFPHPWDSPDKNTGVGCHFLLQNMKVKSESEVAQLCPTLSDLMDCSLPGSSVHGIFQARVLEWGAIAFSIVFPLGLCKYFRTAMNLFIMWPWRA